MRIRLLISIFAAVVSITLWGIIPAQAGIQTTQNFDSSSEWGTLPWGGFTNTATNVTGWVVNNAYLIADATAPSTPYACLLRGTNTTSSAFRYSVDSPAFINGVGSVIFAARLYNVNVSTNQLVLETSTNGINWNAQIQTNIIASTNWVTFTNTIRNTSSLYFSIRKLSNSTANAAAYIDSISVTYPPARISVTNLTTTPATPTENDSLAVSAACSVTGYPDAVTATNYWKLATASSWNAIPMTTNQPNIFATISNIPAQSVFSTIQYYVQVAQISDGVTYFTNSVTNTVSVNPRSSYTNMVVTSPINTSLTLSSNYLWQGVAYVSNMTSAFRFQATSNGVTTTFGDSNQSLSNMLAYGNADINATNIILAATNTGYHLFTFSESDSAYSARPCVYENFEAWSNQGFGTYTNATSKWILSAGSISNDAGGTYAGRYATLNGQQGASTNAFLLSPFLTNGVGDISFWYRKAGTSNTLAGTLLVQVAPAPASTNWFTIATLSNILATSYSFINIRYSDLNSQAVRLLNNPNGNSSQISVDEVVVAAAGASAQAANLTNSPTVPGSFDTVTIAADLTTNRWATLTNVVVWYRGATNLAYQSQPMVASGANHFVSSNGIPPQLGTVQYAIQYACTGALSYGSLFYPPAGTNAPYSYTTTNTAIDYRSEMFDSTARWGTLPWGGFTNTVTNTIGWVVNNAWLNTDATAPSTPYACLLRGTNTTSSDFRYSVDSPLMSNGVGSVVFAARLYDVRYPNLIVVETSPDGITWTAKGTTNLLTSTSWAYFTNSVLVATNTYISIRKLSQTGAGYATYLDNITCTPYPADILVTNVNLNPGYPASGQSVSASCTILSLTPLYPAFNFTPTFYYIPYSGTTNAIPMVNMSGNTYTTAYPFVLANTRDVPLTYWVQSAFAGYAAIPADIVSPRYSTTNTVYVRAFASSYSNLAANVNGTNTSGRLLTNGLWQSIINLSGTNSTFNLSLRGFGYSSGNGAQTNYVSWGNSNNWQTAIPLSDVAGTNQSSINLTGTFSGQYIVRFNELTGEYVVQQCVFQDFENWAGSGGKYIRSINANVPMVVNNFDTWTTNRTQVRFEDFSDTRWGDMIDYTNAAAGGSVGYKIYGSKISSANTNSVQTTNAPAYVLGQRFVVQQSLDNTDNDKPLRGIGTISFRYRANSTTPAVTNGVYFYTNSLSSDFPIYQYWGTLTNIVFSNTTFNTATLVVKTNTTFPVIFSHNNGNQSMFFDDISVDEWYADNQTNSGWMTVEGYIEQRAGAAAGNNCCRFDVTRDNGSDGEYVMSPVLSNGINTLSFSYGGATTNPTSFALEIKYGISGTWSNLATITTNFNGTGSDYRSYSKTLMSSATNIYLRVRNITPKPGVLLVDDFKISGAVAGATWTINNAAIDDTDPSYPPFVRQYYGGAGYLNNTNFSADMSTDSDTAPDTNVWPNLYTPYLSFGVGEISFWYRNWATNAPVVPGRLKVQTSTTDIASTNNSDWMTIYTLDNIANTNDYRFFQISLYDTTSHWVRIYNDTSSGIGRVCLDDVLVTAPIASTLAMSNMVVSPLLPLYTNTVHVTVDLYNFFLNPSLYSVTAYYGSSPTYAGLTSAVVSSRSMVCIASNAPGSRPWYRYQTSSPIPTNAVDAFVKYSVQAAFTGYHAEVTSPITNRGFGRYPSWYKPLDSLYGTNQAYYIVYSCPTGSVWINEFMTDNQIQTYRFLELCGQAGTSISNWQLSVYNNNASQLGAYTIIANSKFVNSTNGFGFWVLGDTTTSPRDMTLTNSLPQNGGFLLTRNVGVYEQALCYGQNSTVVQPLINSGFTYIGVFNDDWYDASVALVGTNTSGMTWDYTTEYMYSPGSINAGQYLQSSVQQNIVPPVVQIIQLALSSTNVFIECTSSNTWAPTPWYSTNLVNSNGWTGITNYWTSYPNLSASNTFTVYFGKPAGSAPAFYKIIVTNTP